MDCERLLYIFLSGFLSLLKIKIIRRKKKTTKAVYSLGTKMSKQLKPSFSVAIVVAVFIEFNWKDGCCAAAGLRSAYPSIVLKLNMNECCSSSTGIYCLPLKHNNTTGGEERAQKGRSRSRQMCNRYRNIITISLLHSKISCQIHVKYRTSLEFT